MEEGCTDGASESGGVAFVVVISCQDGRTGFLSVAMINDAMRLNEALKAQENDGNGRQEAREMCIKTWGCADVTVGDAEGQSKVRPGTLHCLASLLPLTSGFIGPFSATRDQSTTGRPKIGRAHV